MDIFDSDKSRAFIPRYQAFLEEELYPMEAKLLNMDLALVEAELKPIRQKAKQRGLWKPHLDQWHGGPDFTLVEFAQISELLGKSPFGHYCCNCQAPDIGNVELLMHQASSKLQDQYLKPLVYGDVRSCFAMTEPQHAGSNPLNMSTTAELDGDHYVINGHKWFTTAADGAQFVIVMAVTNPEAENKYEQASMILVPTDTEGYQLVRNIPIMGEAGGGYFSHAEISFENCRVPKDNLVGSAGKGFVLAQKRLGPGRIHHCMRWIGICERAFELMCTRASSRELSPGVMLGTKQSVQNWIAESRAHIDAARYSVLHAAYKMEKLGSKAARQQIATIKFYVAQVLQQVLDRAIQTHGALGITDDTLLSFWFRHERGARIYDGPDEVHKSSLARSILKGYGLTFDTHG